ncbi:YczE/YyaS/YitT family protein [Desmospora profundinema]|uniref:Membrane protein YczE n=1 Tax=Desmospora profundinema TaxID=1571184 RepID=A0ABU1IN39_9BACL|nr:YitT family protein [Desmospora profundinema]MDR6225205.1 putative membrane protein YczE [Desmospora profundinema]
MKAVGGWGKKVRIAAKEVDWHAFSIRWGAFMTGLWVMAFGIALMIRADLGLAPWDVLHMGLAMVTPLTVGMWLQLVGFTLVGLAAVLDRKWPGAGALLNMLLVGFFVDLFLAIPWLVTPVNIWGQWGMLIAGIAVMGIGCGLYIAPRLGAGPRDGVVLALSDRWGLSVGRVRLGMEVGVLVCGWMLGGPVFIGTLLFSLAIGPMMQTSIQFWEKMIEQWLGRGVHIEGIHQRAVRPYHHDGLGG